MKQLDRSSDYTEAITFGTNSYGLIYYSPCTPYPVFVHTSLRTEPGGPRRIRVFQGLFIQQLIVTRLAAIQTDRNSI